MATKKKSTKKVATAAQPAPIMIKYTDTPSEGEKEFEYIVPKCPEINEKDFPRRYIANNSRLMIRIDDFNAAYHMMTKVWSDHEIFYSKDSDWWGPCMDQDNGYEHYDDEEGCWYNANEHDVYEWLFVEFTKYGHVYFRAAYCGDKTYNDDDEPTLMQVRIIDPDSQSVVMKGALNFTVKYEPGKNMFYHHDNNRAIRASKIEAVTITKRAGYNQTIEYKMSDGNSVQESNVCTSEMAHEWINSKS